MDTKATAIHAIDLSRVNFYVFDQNYQQVKDLIEYVNEPDRIFALRDDIQEMHNIMYEIVRLLHNFIASAKSLVEYTRNLMRERYAAMDFYTLYQDEVRTRFVNNHLAGFIEELRNYILHYSLPFGTASFSMIPASEENEGSVTFSFSLKKTDLLQWGGWTAAKGRAYLDNADDEIDIEAV